MTQASDAVWLPVLPSMKDFGPALIKGAGSEADKAGDSVGKRFGKGLAAGAAVAAGAVAAAGGALYKVGAVFDDVTDTIRTQTGASGQALDGLVASAKNVGATVPVEFEKIGPVVAGLNQRLGLSGETLEKVSSQYLQAGRILGEDVDINATTAAFSAFGIEGASVEGAMDSLFRVAQSTGIGMNQLAGIVQTAAPAMQNLGFSFDETAALAGTLDKAGLNTQQVMNSMSKGLVTLAKDGEKPQEAFRRTVDEIQGFIAAGDTAGAIDLASKVFGTKGATQFIGALQSGKVNLDELAAAAAGSGDTILGVGQETADFAEQWQLFKNRVLVWLEPLGSRVFGALGTAMGEVNGAVMAFVGAWQSSEADITSSGLPGFFERVAQGIQGVMDLLVHGDFTTKFRTAFGVEEDAPIVGFLLGLRDTFLEVAKVVGPTLGVLGQTFGPLIPQIVQLVTAFSPLGLIMKALAPVLPQIAVLLGDIAVALGDALAQVLPVVVDLMGQLVGTLSGAFVQILPVVTQLVGFLASWLAKVIPMFAGILAAVMPLLVALVTALIPIITHLISSILPPLMDLLMQWADLVVPIVETLLGMLIPAIQFLMPIVTFAFGVIAEVVKVALGIVISVLSGVIGFIKDGVAPVFTWLYENVIKPAWEGISAAISWAWENVITPVFNAIKWYIDNVLAPVINWLWNNVVKPAFDGIGAAIAWVWDNVISPALTGFQWYLDNILGPAINWLWQNVIKPAFDGIGSTIQWVWDNVIKPVFDFLADAIQNKVPAAFEEGKKFIDTIWKGIQDIVKEPVKFVVNTVLNDGLFAAINGVKDFLGIGGDKLHIALPPGFAGGGYTGSGGKYQPAGIVHAGEFVFTKEQTTRAGVGNLYAMARALNGYAQGGLVDPLRGGLIVTQGYNRKHKGIDYAASVGTPVFAANTGVVSWAGPGAQSPGVWGGNEIHVLGKGIETWYAHLSQIGVKLGEMVRAGQQIGLSGNTGISSGPHLHFGVFQGGWPNDLDPGAFLSGKQASGGVFNPVAGIIDGLMRQFREVFPQGGLFVDLVGGFAKHVLDMASDAVMNLLGAQSDGSATGATSLYDSGGVLHPGLTAVLNNSRKPEAVLTSRQWADIHELARREARRDRVGVNIGSVHVRDENEMVRLLRNSERDAQTVYGF